MTGQGSPRLLSCSPKSCFVYFVEHRPERVEALMGSMYKLMVAERTSLILFGNGLRIFTFRFARMFVNMNERIVLLCICPTFLSSS